MRKHFVSKGKIIVLNVDASKTLAEQFDTSKYKDLDGYVRSHAQENLCAFEIEFIDKSKVQKVMTIAQRNAIQRRKDWNWIYQIGGLGYRKIK